MLLLLGISATASAATYSYSTYNPSGAAFTSSNMSSWTNNASISCAANSNGCPIYSYAANGGSLILTSAPQVDSEVNITLSSAIGSNAQGGVGGAVIYLHASATALSTPAAHADAGSFDALQIYQPWCASDGSCHAYWALYERTAAGTSRVVSASTMQYWPGMPVRAVTYGTTFAFLANGELVTLPVTLTGGYQGVGAFGNAGGAIAAVQVGPRCMTVPNAVSSTNVTISAYPTNISMNWPETPQPADVAAVGITEWLAQKNGASYGTVSFAAAWDDPNVVPSSSYAYAIAAVSFHGVAAAYSGTLTVKTPSALNVDPVRTGVRPLGAYWGSAPENIDMASGNLNLTIPLLRPQGRGGWSVPIALTYNSQIWKSDSAGIQNMGLDVGYGYGWKMLAGSLTPFWNPASNQLDHYLYTDATGGQYRLYQSGVGNIWISHLYPASSGLSGEAIYVYYDSDSNLLHFRDGSSWYMGCVSSGEEQDAGTMYPTILEDRNGNQVIITYVTGLGTDTYSASPTGYGPNSSARILSIEDTRATGTPRTTYNFTWSAPDVNNIQHIASITNTIGTSEAYTFSFVQGLAVSRSRGVARVQAPSRQPVLAGSRTTTLNTYYWM